MAFTITDYHDLVDLLYKNPQWRAELRQLVLSEELIDLPAAFQKLLEQQQKTDDRIDRLTVRLDVLTEQVQTLTLRLDVLTDRVDTLTERVDAIAEQLQLLTQRVDKMAEMMERRFTNIDNDMGKMKGKLLEITYSLKPHNYFRKVLKRAKEISGDELHNLLEGAVEQGVLTETESDDILGSDLILRGLRAQDNVRVYAAVEISWGVGVKDVERAARRASLLAKLGTPTLPIVAGEWVTPDANDQAPALDVWRMVDGQPLAPEG